VVGSSRRSNLITSYGRFWRLDETEWQGESGAKGSTGLYGKRGKRRVDFWTMPGVYVLYGDFGAYYSGITTKQGVGQRISQHSHNKKHKGNFDRFSWFGFGEISATPKKSGLYEVVQPKTITAVKWRRITNDIEAILHRAFPFTGTPAGFGVRKTDPFTVEEWNQVTRQEARRLRHL
jgi:hypothetical protein